MSDAHPLDYGNRTSFPRPPTPYESYMEAQGIPIHRGMSGVRDGRELPRGEWKRLGARGAFVELDGLGNLQGLYVLEVPQGGSTTPERHLYEEVFVVLEGSGHTEVWVDGSSRDTVEWRKNTVFTVPLNAIHTHVADQGGPAVLLCGNNAPPVMQLYRSEEFVFCTEFHFADRYVPGRGFYEVRPLTKEPNNWRALNSNAVIPDVTTVQVPLDGQRGEGSRHFELRMGGNYYEGFVAEYAPGKYSKAHSHSSGAILVCVRGEGYTLAWPRTSGMRPWENGRGDTVVRTSYGPGGFVSAAPGGADWYHAHFAVSKEPFRVCTMSGGFVRNVKGRPGDTVFENQDMSEGAEGDQIAYPDEDPKIRELFRTSIESNGGRFTMPDALCARPAR